MLKSLKLFGDLESELTSGGKNHSEGFSLAPETLLAALLNNGEAES